MSAIEGRGASAGAPAPATGHAHMYIPLIIDRYLVPRHRFTAIEGLRASAGASAGAPAPERDMHRHVFQPTSTAIWCTGIAVPLFRDEERVPARRRRQGDMHRHVFQSTSTAVWCTGTTVPLLTGDGHVPSRMRRQRDMHRHVLQSTPTAIWCTGGTALLRDEVQVLARRRRQRDMHRHVFQSTSTALWSADPALNVFSTYFHCALSCMQTWYLYTHRFAYASSLTYISIDSHMNPP